MLYLELTRESNLQRIQSLIWRFQVTVVKLKLTISLSKSKASNQSGKQSAIQIPPMQVRLSSINNPPRNTSSKSSKTTDLWLLREQM